MAGASQFTIGAGASCGDGAAGRVSRVIAGPPAGEVTRLAAEPGHRRDPGRLVPPGLAGGAAGEIRLRCTRAASGKLEPAQERQFMPAASGHEGYGCGPGQVGYWPCYGLGGGMGVAGLGLGGGTPSQAVTRDTVAPGETGVRRGGTVRAADGDIGRVQGLVIDPGSRQLTRVLLQEGHLRGRREVAIPVSAVASTSDGIQLTIARQEVQDLPPVDIGHLDRSTGGTGS
jgi:hypothetical protein